MIKKVMLIILMIYCSHCLLIADTMTYDDGKFSFDYSGEVIIEDDFPEFRSYIERSAFLDDKYCLSVIKYEAKDITIDNGFSKGLIESFGDTQRLESYLDTTEYSFWGRNIHTSVPASYQEVVINERIVGEVYLQLPHDGLLYPRGYSYVANIIHEGLIYLVTLSYYDINDKLPILMPEYFHKNGEEWYWNNRNKVSQLYTSLNNRLEIPNELLKLDEYWDDIMISIYEEQSEKTVHGFLNDSAVRLRDEPNLDADQLTLLNKNEHVVILDETSTAMQIGKLYSVWYRVRTDDNLEGWVYGYYIDLK